MHVPGGHGGSNPVQRAAVVLACLTPPLAILACAPTQFTRFQVPRAPLAWIGIWLGLLCLGSTSPSRIPRRMLLPGGALLAWGALSLIGSPARGAGELLLLGWGMALCWSVLLGLLSGRDPRLVPWLLASWLAAGALCAVLALVQRLGFLRLGLHQITGTIGNPNHLAGVLLLLLPAARWLWRQTRHRWLALGGGAVCVAGLLASGCKSGVLALVAMIIWWHWCARAPRRWIVAALLASLCPLAVPGWRHLIQRDLAGRRLINRVSIAVWSEHPLRGAGLGAYPVAAAPLQGRLIASAGQHATAWSNLRDAHSLPLGVAADLGLVGLALLLIWILPVLRADPRRLPEARTSDPLLTEAGAAWIGLLVQGLAESALMDPASLVLAFGWLGLAQQRQSRISPARAQGTPGDTRIIAWLLIPLAGWGVWRTGLQATSDWHLGRGLQLAASQPARAAHHLQRSVDLAVDPAEPLFYRGMIRASVGQLDEAAADVGRSQSLTPSPERATALGNLALRRGDGPDAVRWFRQAVALHPRYTPAHNNLGLAYLQLGRYRDARRHLIRARSLRPSDPRVKQAWRLLLSMQP